MEILISLNLETEDQEIKMTHCWSHKEVISRELEGEGKEGKKWGRV